jgi:putative endonuclease
MSKIGYFKGIIAEYVCIVLMFFRGHKIIGRRIKTPVGEIDVLTKKNNKLHVVEVKYRKRNLDEAKLALCQSAKRVKQAYVWLKYGQKTKVTFMYFIMSGRKFEFGSFE